MPYAKKGKVQSSIFFDMDVHDALKRYSKNNVVSISSYVNKVIKQEMVRLGEMIDTDCDSIAELVSKNYDALVKNTEIPKAILDQVKRGSKPDDITLLRIHGALQIPEAELRELMAKTNYDEKKTLSGTLEKTNKGLKRT